MATITITTAEDFVYYMGTGLTITDDLELGNDIDFSGYLEEHSITTWNAATISTGSFNGNGHSIKNLLIEGATITPKANSYRTIFYCTNTSTDYAFKNLVLDNCHFYFVSSSAYNYYLFYGTFCSDITIKGNCSVELTVSNTSSCTLYAFYIYSNAAPLQKIGIAGTFKSTHNLMLVNIATSNSTQIRNCYVTANLEMCSVGTAVIDTNSAFYTTGTQYFINVFMRGNVKVNRNNCKFAPFYVGGSAILAYCYTDIEAVNTTGLVYPMTLRGTSSTQYGLFENCLYVQDSTTEDQTTIPLKTGCTLEVVSSSDLQSSTVLRDKGWWV